MPSEKLDLSDTSSGPEHYNEYEGEREKDREKNGSKSKNHATQGQTKSKDVSHVPCKFFRLNQCTAGSSCPFSHQQAEPGQQKETCQWFLKGNCKFGHKCALAHILPGQPMSMDRKNKKAAQQAAAAGGTANTNTVGTSTSRGEKRKTGSAKEESLRIGIARGLGRGSAPISISRATLSPSAPAPPLRDTDFPLGLPEEFIQSVSVTAKQVDSQGNSDSDSVPTNVPVLAEVVITSPRGETTQQASTPPQQDTLTDDNNILPVSKPSAPRGFTRQNGVGDFGFGPIGSPPRSSPAHTPTSQPIPQSIHQVNGFSPSVSPNATGLLGNAMPASSPFSKNAFMSYSLDLDASASTQVRVTGTRPPISGAMSLSGISRWEVPASAVSGAVEEDDFEEFLPLSLNELLTDEEKKRRLSRTGGQRPVLETHHRYSRSVPAVNLMDGVKSLWNDSNSGDLQSSAGLSPSFLGTSNVSTGFLPRRTPVNSRAFVDAPPTLTASNTHLNFSSSGSSLTTGFISPPLPNLFSSNRATTTATQSHSITGSSQPFDLLQQPRPIPVTGQELFNGNPLSPTARALQEHAPGQSLPQGLAAGLSRLHIRPPASIGTNTNQHLSGLSVSPGARLMGGSSFTGNNNEYTGLIGLSQVTSTNSQSLASLDSRSGGLPSRGRWPSLSMKSPLTSAVITNDDGLFEMDEDK
ncbi:hypothetical protein Clacol_009128 [Clathrus columnatus]|uniref:C3H1-type domain-containing protein n=1 Tax=Clathrus columnatus TaxID=1419009 RepID=A0AAV5ASJ1_9AGAM|nr:hypothetical protein Clacol_009128 [Clathrus columnatus]